MVSSDRVKPGGKGRITVKVDTTGRTGQLTKTVEVTSNDPKKTKTILMVRATIK